MGGHAVHATAAYRAMLRTRMKSIQMVLLHFPLWFYMDFRSFRLKFYFALFSSYSTFVKSRSVCSGFDTFSNLKMQLRSKKVDRIHHQKKIIRWRRMHFSLHPREVFIILPVIFRFVFVYSPSWNEIKSIEIIILKREMLILFSLD